MTDLELCRNKDYYAIFTKYTMMFYKIWDSLSPALKFNVWPEEADFFSFCYEKTVMAVNSIKPEKVKNPDTWTIYIQLFRYIKTYALREIEKEYKQNVCSLDSFIEENDYDVGIRPITLDLSTLNTVCTGLLGFGLVCSNTCLTLFPSLEPCP